MAAIMVAIANETIVRTHPPKETHRMSPMPPKRPAGTEGAYASLAPQQAARPGFDGSQVDFTNQESFAAGVDDSPYANVKSAKRAAKALGKPLASAPKKAARSMRGSTAAPAPQQRAPQQGPAVPIPGTVDMRTQMHVVVGGTHHASAHKPAASQAQRAQKAPYAACAAGQNNGAQTGGTVGGDAAPVSPTAGPTPEFPSEAQYVKAAKERPAASPNIARPKPKPGQAANGGAEGAANRAGATGAEDAAPAPAPSSRAGQTQAAGEGSSAHTAARQTSREAARTSRRARGSRAAGIGAAAGQLVPRDTETFVRRASIGLTCLACVVAACLTLYAPAQQLYSAMRENERLTDELAQNQTRVDALKKSVSALQTAEGVQDMAHKTWGLVMPDEVPVTVDNASYTPTDTPIPAEVKRGSGRNTSTWVTDVLDQVFGEAGATDATEKDESVATLSETGEGASDDTAAAAQVASALPAQDAENDGE